MNNQNLLTHYDVEIPVTLPITVSVWIKGIKALSKHEVLEVVRKIPKHRLLLLLLEQQLNQPEDSFTNYAIAVDKVVAKPTEQPYKKSVVGQITEENIFEADQIKEQESKCSKHLEEDE